GDGQPEEAFCERVDFVVSLVSTRLDEYYVVTGEPGPNPEKAECGHHLLPILLRHQIGRDLRLYELVVRHVFVQRMDHPVAIAPGVGVSIARHAVPEKHQAAIA